jgi:hypothetical protein
MSITPGLIALVNTPQYGAANLSVPPSQVPGLIGIICTVAAAPMWMLAGAFKGIFWYTERPIGALNTRDYYYNVIRGCMLVTDGSGSWFNPLSPALPPN